MYKRVVYFPVQTTRAFSHWSSEWVEDKELISFRIYTIYTEREREKQPVSRSASQPVTQLTAVTAAEWVKFKGRTSLKKRTNLSLLMAFICKGWPLHHQWLVNGSNVWKLRWPVLKQMEAVLCNCNISSNKHQDFAQSFQISLESWNASCAIQKEHTSMCRLTSLLAGASSLPPKPAPGTGKVWIGWSMQMRAKHCSVPIHTPHAPHMATHFKI